MTLLKRRVIFNFLLFAILLIASLVWSRPSQASPNSLAQALLACGSPSDACWENGFHVPGVLGTIYAIQKDSHGNVYVGGEIVSAGGVPVNNLAMWDGATWHDVGGGVTYTTSYAPKVYTLAVGFDDSLYVGGTFNQAGSVSANSLARWTGSMWDTVGGGTDGSVMVIKAVSGGIYVGGNFPHVGNNILANNIALYNFGAANWVTLGSGLDDTVYALEYEPTSSSWFVGGDFSHAGGVEAYRIARYMGGSSWQAVGGGLSSGGTVNALLRVARDGGGYDLYAGGAFPQVNTAVGTQNIARWDGSSWYALNGGISGEVKAIVRSSSGDLIVAGDFSSVGASPGTVVNNIARWNAIGGWSVLGNGLGTVSFEEVNALMLSGTEVIAGGRFELAGNQVVNNLARWNSSAWSSMDGGLGVNNTVDVLLADGVSVFASGSINRFGSQQATGLAKLSGSTWSGEGSPAAYYIRALVKSGSTNLYAGGAFTSIGGVSANYLAHWNGSVWQQLAGGTNGYVNALALGNSGKLYVGGEFTTTGGSNPTNHIAMWDGTWHNLGEGLDGAVRVLALDSSGNLYAGGDFSYAGAIYVNHIAMWDGSKWNALGSGLSNKYVLALIFDSDGRLYAGGYFANAGGKLVNGVAMWNGYEWSALGSGMNDGVGALAVDSSGYLYAGGDFHTAGGKNANHIALWDGFSWSGLGSGTDNSVYQLAISPSNRLVAGGAFKMAGAKPSTYIAVYDFPPPGFAPAPTLSSLAPANTAKGGAGFWLTVNGTNFSSRSVVHWNGNTLITTYVNGSQLKAFIPAEFITTASKATIIVFTPASSGGGASTSLNFEILNSYKIFLPSTIR